MIAEPVPVAKLIGAQQLGHHLVERGRVTRQ
jgi:hypothetical protein